MKRQILCLLLALALSISLCACGNMRTGYTDDMPDPDDGYIENGNADDGVVDDDSNRGRLPGSGVTGSGNTTNGGMTGSGNTTGGTTNRSGNPTDGNGNTAGTGRTDGMGNRSSVPGVTDMR